MNASKSEETIFAEALRLPPDERAAYLAQSTHGNAELRQRVESLLGSYEAGDFLEQAAAAQLRQTLPITVPLTEKPGDTIGRYKLLQQIGEGGCGVVYMAEQTEPVRRRVALKIIKLGMDTKSVIARFEAERQAVAMMDHPNIAKVFDAGATDTGRPYFVMELVRGMKITEYCDEAKLSTRARLDLFVQVCQAIQHAHQKGIIHRDIKPSNILVTVNDGVPVPKVIDFGIAKATSGQQLTDKTVFTAFEQFIGTPAYMSPEQAMLTSLDIDTRSDIYALGVLLYEMLTGRTPFDAKELLAIGLDEMRRTIREQEPPRPSTRISTLAQNELSTTAQRRGIAAPKLVSELRGDLDWIVMKTLEKDRARRYETANGLASDIERHLNNEPVVACPPSNLYRFQKLVRRNKLAFTAAAAVAAALVLGLGVATWMFFRERSANREQVRLRQEAQRAQAREEQQRRAAETEELKARQNLYAADMSLAYQALERGNREHVRRMLAKYSSNAGSGNHPRQDPRGWEWRNLWQRSRGDESVVLSGRSNLVTFAGMLSDARSVVSVDRDGTISFWDVNTGRLVESVQYPNETRCGALSLDGRWLAVGGGSSFQRGYWSLWDLAGRKLRFARTNLIGVTGVSFSPDSSRVAVAGQSAVEVWNVQGFRFLAGISRRDMDFKHGLAFSPDGNTLAYSEGPDNMVTNSLMLWDLESGKSSVLGTLERGSALGLAFTSNGRTLICGERSGISLWDISTRRLQERLTNHVEQVVSVALSPDGKLMASAGGDQTVRLWDTESWRERCILRGHEADVHSVTFSPDGKKLLSGGKDEAVRVWDVEGKPARRETYVCPPGWLLMPSAPDIPRQLRIQNRGGTAIGFLDLTRCEEEGTQPSPILFAPDKIITAAERRWNSANDVSGDASKLAILRADGGIEVWSTMPFARIKAIAPGPVGARSIALGRTGASLAVEREDGRVEILDLTRDRTTAVLEPLPFPEERDGIFALGISFWARDTRLVRMTQAPADAAEILEVVRLPGAESKRIRMTHKGWLNNFALSSDGSLLATSAWDGQIKLWDTGTAREIHTFSGQFIAYMSLAFAPDGSRLAAGAWDGSITLWDLSSLNQVAHWRAHAHFANRVCFLEGGDALMTRGSVDEVWGNWETRVWRPPSFAEIEAAEKAPAYGVQTR